MEKYKDFDDAILGLQNEVNKYTFSKFDSPAYSPNRNDKEINILSSKSIPKIDSSKMMIVFPIALFLLLIYFKPNFIMVDKPYDKKGRRIDYSKVIITVSLISGLLYIVLNSV